MSAFRVRAPGRVNIIGDHTDYTGGLCFPMAIDRHTEIIGTYTEAGTAELTSADLPGTVVFGLPVADLDAVTPSWGRYVAGVAAEIERPRGLTGRVSTTIPVGAGLSSSAALEVAAALAFGFGGDALAMAQLCQRAEQRATGVPTGILDQFAIAGATAGHAMILDCGSLRISQVRLPERCEVVVIFVAHRTLVGSAYADRVAECAAAEAIVGSLRTATLAALDAIDDDVVRARARHVVTENQRVLDFAEALQQDDLPLAGRLMVDGHRSLATDYATSTPQMDAAVADLEATKGVYGARMTGGGFGGCVVALTEPGALGTGWVVQPSQGAHRVE